MTEVQSGIPDRNNVLSILNEAYDGWGDEDYFAWKYDEYPEFDPQEHSFYIKDDGIAAFRRVFRKQLLVDSERITTFVLGDTAVAPDYRGQGYYSSLHSETTEYCREAGSSATITYNNIDNVTFKANRKRGWKYSTLPLNLYIHSYEKVLKQYADLATGGDSLLFRLGGRIGDRIELHTGDEEIVVSEIFGTEEKTNERRFRIRAEPQAIARLIESISNGAISQTISATGKQLASGNITVLSEPTESEEKSRNFGVEVLGPDDVSDEDREAMKGLYQISRAGRAAFRRERQDIDHLLKYPDAEILIVRERSDLVGFAVIGPFHNRGALEARVLDLVAPADAIFRQLVTTIEQHTAEREFDLIVLLTKRNLGPRWAAINRQVIMWDELGDKDLKHVFPPQVSMYDVL